MKLEYFKDKKELLSITLLALSALMAVLILYKLTSFITDSARAEKVVKTALENINSETLDVEKYFTKDRNTAESLTRNNLFAPPASIEHPVKEVRAILGDQVFINNNWYSEGQTIPGNAKVIAIEPMQVMIEWEGRQTTFRPIDASTPEPERTGRATTRAGSANQDRPDMVVVGSTQTGQMPGRRGMGIDMQNMRSTFQNMSQAERERLREEMIQRFGGNRAFGGGRGDSGGFGGGRGGRGGGRGGRGGGRGG